MYEEFICPDCGEINHIRYLPATRTDPGCYEDDLECVECGATLDAEDGEPFNPDDYHPDL